MLDVRFFSNASTSYILDYINLIEFCKASNEIYKISCNVRNLSYISETSRELRLRTILPGQILKNSYPKPFIYPIIYK